MTELHAPEPRQLDPQLALAIAAAARQLPDLTPAQLVEILLRVSNGELSATALAGLTPKSLRKAGGDLLNDADGGSLRAALDLLQGEALAAVDSPEVSSAELSGQTLWVACTSNSGEQIDGHFGSCLRILIYEVGSSGWALRKVLPTLDCGHGEARSLALLELIKGCQLLITLSIGGPAAARVTNNSIHPLRVKLAEPAAISLTRLQQVVGGNPPPWLAKILGRNAAPAPWQATASDWAATAADGLARAGKACGCGGHHRDQAHAQAAAFVASAHAAVSGEPVKAGGCGCGGNCEGGCQCGGKGDGSSHDCGCEGKGAGHQAAGDGALGAMAGSGCGGGGHGHGHKRGGCGCH
ncbi:MAG: hypothetical protein II007_00395 [Gammaproteobacteria bacterium]|nr:hypothetical protein [Gammaproteobacteria bacterium]